MILPVHSAAMLMESAAMGQAEATYLSEATHDCIQTWTSSFFLVVVLRRITRVVVYHVDG